MINPKDIDELFEEVKVNSDPSETDNLPESPASANIKIWIDGFGVQFTMRDLKMNNVVKKIRTLIDLAKENGWKPKWDDTPSLPTQVPSRAVQEVSGPVCKVHGKLMTKGKWGYYCKTKVGDDAQGNALWCKEKA